MENLEIQVICDAELVDILIAEMSVLDFETFEENENGFLSFHPDPNYDIQNLQFLVEKYASLGNVEFLSQQIEKINWNKEWESNYSPIEIQDKVYIRASFHPPKPAIETEILINPQMSFGTGHHETTRLVIELMMEENWEGQEVLDAGTGTGILAIYASLKGAKSVLGFDIDDWCVENALENAALNPINHFTFQQGTIKDQKSYLYHSLIANINRNILLQEMEEYVKFIRPGGHLYLSGFYLEDCPVIQESAESFGLTYQTHKTLNNWCAIKFIHVTT